MYISTFEFNNKYLLSNMDLLHKAVMMMFDDNRAKENVLYMVLGKNLVVQSTNEPQEKCRDSLTMLHTKDVSYNTLNENDVIVAYGVFEPTVHKKGHDYIIPDMNDRMNWVSRKFSDSAEVLVANEKSKTKVFIEKKTGDKRTTFLYGYELMLHITDKEKFAELLKKGIGRSKSYGAGMCIVMHKVDDV